MHCSMCTEHLRHGFPWPHLTLAAWQLSHDVRYFGSRLVAVKEGPSCRLAMVARGAYKRRADRDREGVPSGSSLPSRRTAHVVEIVLYLPY
jgi:hypothetical protein